MDLYILHLDFNFSYITYLKLRVLTTLKCSIFMADRPEIFWELQIGMFDESDMRVSICLESILLSRCIRYTYGSKTGKHSITRHSRATLTSSFLVYLASLANEAAGL